MTLVVTTVSAFGITVVGDRAVTRRTDSGVELLKARKIWYSPEANVALAFWGNANLPGDESLEDWARRFVANIQIHDSVASVCERLVSTLNPELESLGKPWLDLRRGIHVSGYENDLPVIFHVHTGDPHVLHHPLKVHRDFPDIYSGGPEKYRQHLAGNGHVQLRNGYYSLFATLAQTVFESRADLTALLKQPVPANSLAGQAAFDEALVRLAAGILKSAQLHQSVSADVNVVAFTPRGLAFQQG